VTIWETEADREAGEASGYYREQIRKFADLLTETPVRKHYEVSVLEQAQELARQQAVARRSWRMRVALRSAVSGVGVW
jgi:hypothetical protein